MVDTTAAQQAAAVVVVSDTPATAVTNSNDTNNTAQVKQGLDKDCNCIYHVVQPGDTLWNITQRYQDKGLTIDKLKAENSSLFSRPIKVGDIVKILL